MVLQWWKKTMRIHKKTAKTTNKEKNLGGLRVPRHQVTWYFPTGWISPFSWRLSPRLSWISFLAGCVKDEVWDWCTKLGPENGTFERRDAFWKPSCSGFILVFRWGVLHSPKLTACLSGPQKEIHLIQPLIFRGQDSFMEGSDALGVSALQGWYPPGK